jgi:hypothetical protein
MELLVELLTIIEEAKKSPKVSRTLRAKVYHADYQKTKHKPYRKRHSRRDED